MYSPTLRRRIVEFVDAAKAAGMSERDCCEAIGISRQSVAVWRKAVPSSRERADAFLDEVPIEATSKALVPVEVTTSSVQLGTALALVTPRGFRVEGLSLEQAFSLLRDLS
jgi:transposase-like protein